MTSSLFRTFDTGPAFSMHGAQADREIRLHSDLTEQRDTRNAPFGHQGLRQDEALALAHQVDGMIDMLKSLRGAFASRAGSLAKAGDDTYLGRFAKVLKKAKRIVADAEDEDGGDAETVASAITTVEKLLNRAKALLVDAHDESETEDEESAVEKARADLRKVVKSLTTLKSKAPAPAVAAPATGTAPAVTTKALAEIDKACGVVQGQLKDVIDMIGKTSRGAGVPPNFAVIKSEAANVDEPTSIRQRIAHLQDIGVIDTNTAIEAKSLTNRLALVKSGQGDIEEFRHHLARSRGIIKDDIFKDV